MKVEEVPIGNELYVLALNLRHELFFEELGLPKSVVPDDLEDTSVHFAMSNDGELIGYARLSEVSANDYRISQVVVSPKHQGRGYSTTLLQHIMAFGESAGAKMLRLNSQVHVIGLYEKLGFQTIGEEYIVKLTGVPYKKMIYHVNT